MTSDNRNVTRVKVGREEWQKYEIKPISDKELLQHLCDE